jgi:hypothetical protein
MTRRSLLSFLGGLVAAAASMATSAPNPDWTLEDTADGVVTLNPDQKEVVIKLRVTSEVVPSNLGFDVSVDPAPARGPTLADTPIAFFVSTPYDTAGFPATRFAPVPSATELPPDGYDSATGVSVDAKQGARDYEVHLTWTSPNKSDLEATQVTSSSSSSIEVPVYRTVAPPRAMTIKWRARLGASGYDDQPAGAKVVVDPSP